MRKEGQYVLSSLDVLRRLRHCTRVSTQHHHGPARVGREMGLTLLSLLACK